MTPRLIEVGRDYPEICEWWRFHKWPHIPVSALPPTGVIIEEDGQKYCAGWIYFMEANWACMEWIVTNPKSPLKRRKAAIELLVDTIIGEARARGVKNMFSSVKNENLAALYQARGFKRGDSGMINMVWGER